MTGPGSPSCRLPSGRCAVFGFRARRASPLPIGAPRLRRAFRPAGAFVMSAPVQPNAASTGFQMVVTLVFDSFISGAPMRFVKFLAFATILGLSGCLDSTSSVASTPSPGFVLSQRYLFGDKIVLRAASGNSGPMFLMTGGLNVADSTGTTYELGGTFPYGAVDAATPWIDADLWIDYQVREPRISFWDLSNPFRSAAYGAANWLDLSQCPDLPKSVFQAAKDSGVNPVEHQSILRVGRFVFLPVQNYWGLRSISRPGIALVRMGDISQQTSICSKYDDANAALASKWIDLHPYRFDVTDSARIQGKFLSAVQSESGIYLSYWTQGDSISPDKDRTYLAFLDTTGNMRILDSSTTSYYAKLFTFGKKTWAIRDGGEISELPSPTASPIKKNATWNGLAAPPCRDIQGQCVLHAADLLYTLDTATFAIKSIDASGLGGNQITGVVQHKDTVYVSTLSGVFTKPVSRFFETAK